MQQYGLSLMIGVPVALTLAKDAEILDIYYANAVATVTVLNDSMLPCDQTWSFMLVAQGGAVPEGYEFLAAVSPNPYDRHFVFVLDPVTQHLQNDDLEFDLYEEDDDEDPYEDNEDESLQDQLERRQREFLDRIKEQQERDFQQQDWFKKNDDLKKWQEWVPPRKNSQHYLDLTLDEWNDPFDPLNGGFKSLNFYDDIRNGKRKR